jgi:DNA-damage-inducible protein D
MVSIGSSTSREIEDIVLSRYACYLIVQNGDPSKPIIALGQTYFAKSTREHELSLAYELLPEDEKRLKIREDIKEHNKSLAQAASLAGVTEPYDYAIFQNKGYQGLYGGLDNQDIKTIKGLKKKDNILDYMGSTELAANLFRATQTDEQLRKLNIKGKQQANELHLSIGKKVRAAIRDIGGTMPENLPTPKRSIKELEKQKKSLPSNEAN